MAIEGHVATNISDALAATIPRIRQSTPDSKALNPVSGKSHSKEALRACPVWNKYSTAYARYLAPLKSQLTTLIEIAGCSSRPAS